MDKSPHGIAPGYVSPGGGLMSRNVAASSASASPNAAREQSAGASRRDRAAGRLSGGVLSVVPVLTTDGTCYNGTYGCGLLRFATDGNPPHHGRW